MKVKTRAEQLEDLRWLTNLLRIRADALKLDPTQDNLLRVGKVIRAIIKLKKEIGPLAPGAQAILERQAKIAPRWIREGR